MARGSSDQELSSCLKRGKVVEALLLAHANNIMRASRTLHMKQEATTLQGTNAGVNKVKAKETGCSMTHVSNVHM